MANLVDLDAFVEEQEKDPPRVKFKGKTYDAPSEIPWLAFERAARLNDREADPTELFEEFGRVISLILGKEAWNAMREDGIGYKAAMHAMNSLLEQGTQRMEAEAEGESAPKAEDAKRASGSPQAISQESSDASKPTSGASFSLGQRSSNGSG